MTRDDIIRMAREAGCGWSQNGTEPVLIGEEQLTRFANLIAAAEREACAKLCDSVHENAKVIGRTDTYMGEYASEFDAGFGSASCECAESIRLYMAPHKREPLTEEEISKIFIYCGRDKETFARAIERVHGIGGEE